MNGRERKRLSLRAPSRQARVCSSYYINPLKENASMIAHTGALSGVGSPSSSLPINTASIPPPSHPLDTEHNSIVSEVFLDLQYVTVLSSASHYNLCIPNISPIHVTKVLRVVQHLDFSAVEISVKNTVKQEIVAWADELYPKGINQSPAIFKQPADGPKERVFYLFPPYKVMTKTGWVVKKEMANGFGVSIEFKYDDGSDEVAL
jgi:hypothetical protein